MAKIHGDKSLYLIKEEKKARILFWLSFFFVVISSLFYLPLSFIYRGNHLISFLILVVFWVIGILLFVFAKKKTRQVLDYFRGIKSEYAISYELRKLPNDYHLLQSLMIGKYGNIDFVVVGPTGVFAIEVKSKKLTIDYYGNELSGSADLLKKFMSQTMRGALSISEELKANNLKVFVEPVLVSVNKFSKIRYGLKKKDNVFIVGKGFLRELILRNKKNISKEEVDRIVEVLEPYQEKFVKK